MALHYSTKQRDESHNEPRCVLLRGKKETGERRPSLAIRLHWERHGTSVANAPVLDTISHDRTLKGRRREMQRRPSDLLAKRPPKSQSSGSVQPRRSGER